MKDRSDEGGLSAFFLRLVWLVVTAAGLGGVLLATVVAVIQSLYLAGKPFYVTPGPWVRLILVPSIFLVASGQTGRVVQRLANRRGSLR